MSETVDHLSRPIALSNLREWVLLCKSEMNVQPDMYDSGVQRAADELNLITAFRNMAIKAGEWPCKCGHFHLAGCLGQEGSDPDNTRPCSCLEYRPEEL